MLGPRDPDDYLLPTERRVIRVRRHWAWLSRVLAETVVILIATIWLSSVLTGPVQDMWPLRTVLWYIEVAAVVRFAYRVLEWWVERVVITDKRFMLTNGIIETKISLMPITKVTDMSYFRPVAGRILGYGTLRLESAGQKQDLERISYIPRPEEVYDAISELIFGEKGEGRKPSLAPPRGRGRRR
ncbi:MAG: PH domain-containing protein [Pseudonocardiaceae bacterium]